MFNEDFLVATNPKTTPVSGKCPVLRDAQILLEMIRGVDPQATIQVVQPDYKYPYPVFVLSSESLVEEAVGILQRLPIKCPTYPGLGFGEALCTQGVEIHLPVPQNLLQGYVSALLATSIPQPA